MTGEIYSADEGDACPIPLENDVRQIAESPSFGYGVLVCANLNEQVNATGEREPINPALARITIGATHQRLPQDVSELLPQPSDLDICCEPIVATQVLGSPQDEPGGRWCAARELQVLDVDTVWVSAASSDPHKTTSHEPVWCPPVAIHRPVQAIKGARVIYQSELDGASEITQHIGRHPHGGLCMWDVILNLTDDR